LIPIKDNIPTDRFPAVTFALIVANVVAYVVAAAHGGSLISGPDGHELVRYGAVPHTLASGHRPDTIVTSMFLHASIVQLLVNLGFLWIFGNNVEDSMGASRFLAFYVAGGLVTLAVAVAVGPSSTAPIVGTAGAISAVMGGYLVLYRRARTLTLVLIPLFFTVIEVPTVVMLAVWFAVQVAFAATGLIDPVTSGGVAPYVSHLAGFALGLAMVRPLATRRKPTPPTAAVYR